MAHLHLEIYVSKCNELFEPVAMECSNYILDIDER